jgi:hypothetical protein
MKFSEENKIDLDYEIIYTKFISIFSRNKNLLSNTSDIGQEVFKQLTLSIDPRFAYAIYPVKQICDDKLFIDDNLFFQSDLLTQIMVSSKKIAIIICTLGNHFDEKLSKYKNEDSLMCVYLFDHLGSLAVSILKKEAVDYIRKKLFINGQKISIPLSPGHECWPLEQQRILFQLLPENPLDIRLNESCLMLPLKSLSCVLGIGPEVVSEGTSCDHCSKKEYCKWNQGSEKS